MAALLPRFRFAVRLALVLFVALAPVGCASFDNYDDCDYDADTAGYHRGGSVSPGAQNARLNYRNG